MGKMREKGWGRMSATIQKNPVKTVLCFTVLCFGFWAVLFSLCPMTEDDRYFWSLGLRSLPEIRDFALRYGNGRLLGNLGVFYLVEYPLLRVLVKAGVLTGMTLLLPAVLGLCGSEYRLGSFLLLTLLSPSLFAQVYTWTSGFQNYVPPLFLLLLNLWLCRRSRGWALALPVLGLSFAMQLYVEHSSAIHVLMGLGLCLWAGKWDKKRLPCAGAFLLGAVLGLGLMLALPTRIAAPLVDMATYKGLAFSGGPAAAVMAIGKNTVVVLAQFADHAFLLAALSVLSLRLLRQQGTWMSVRERRLISAALLPTAAVMLLSQTVSMGRWFGDVSLWESLGLALCMGLWLLGFLWTVLRLALREKQRDWQLLAVFSLLAVLSVAPMLVLRPLVCRMGYHGYLVLCAAALWMLHLDCALPRQPLRTGLCLLAAAAALWLGVHFGDIHRMTEIREDYLAGQIAAGETQMDYFMVPSEYVFDYFDPEVYGYYYHRRYSAEPELEAVPADVWFNRHVYGVF